MQVRVLITMDTLNEWRKSKNNFKPGFLFLLSSTLLFLHLSSDLVDYFVTLPFCTKKEENSCVGGKEQRTTKDRDVKKSCCKLGNQISDFFFPEREHL